jgi:CxxC-x17-CxxC domain-containing protein
MLVDKDYRQKIIANLKDPVIKAFWIHEYEAWQDKFRNEAIAPIQNKVGQFLSTSIIRNIVGQSVSTINIFDIMNEGKIFLVNVSKGRIGEDNSSLLGGMIITKIQLAAMERVRIPEDERKDFYLYVDEFQNFVTDAFAGILSEARKYRLNLTVAHQYTAQLVSDKNSSVRDAIFGNVGTMIIFRVGADDAEFLEKEFDPEFTPQDIVNLPNYKIYLKLMIDGITSRPFSGKTIPPMVKSGNKEIEEEVINSSRNLYCKTKEVVEREINDWSGMSIGNDADIGGVEKFKAICSMCGKETMVPFKPEPGRAVYCRDCIAKIKSGELKPIAGSVKQIRQDETKFYKPLSDLGIEFEKKDGIVENEAEERYPERIDRPVPHEAEKKVPVKIALSAHSRVFSTIKKVFTKTAATEKSVPVKPVRDNSALKEVLNKALSENKPQASESKVEEPPIIIPKPTLTPISLDALKTGNKEKPSNDRGASAEEMNKLKNFIEATNITPKNIPNVEKEKKEPEIKEPNIPVDKTKKKEVPEDVLRKILE